jgi:hypothetical protein
MLRGLHHSPTIISAAVLIAACVALVLPGVSSAQNRVTDSVMRTPPTTRTDSIRANSALIGSSLCQIQGDSPNPIQAVRDCELSWAPGPTPAAQRTVDSTSVVVGNWQGLIQTDRITEQKNVHFLLRATDATLPRAVSLMVRCRKGKLDAYVDTRQVLGGDRAHKVTVRFGTEPPEDQEWLGGADSTTLFLSGDQKKVQAFVRKLANYRSFTIQVQSYHAWPQGFEFALDGIDWVSAQLWSGCKPGGAD